MRWFLFWLFPDILAISVLSDGIGVFFFSFEFGSYFGLICFSAYDTIRYDTTWFGSFCFFSFTILGDPHIFTSRMCFFFFHFGWLVHGWFVGFVCTGYDRRLDDDLLFYVGFLVLFCIFSGSACSSAFV